MHESQPLRRCRCEYPRASCRCRGGRTHHAVFGFHGQELCIHFPVIDKIGNMLDNKRLRRNRVCRHHVHTAEFCSPGMVMKIEPLVAAIRGVRREDPATRVILLGPTGPGFNQAKARELAGHSHLLLICGHYEGVDHRVHFYIDEELSIGDYILTGGEIPALSVADAVTRLLPGVLGGEGATEEESFQAGLLEYPHYTRPRVFEGHEVPPVLLEGDHARIAQWRRQQALARTVRLRPDLLAKAALTKEDREFIKSLAVTPGAG